jgi:hypothetical protein
MAEGIYSGRLAAAKQPSSTAAMNVVSSVGDS